jgi:hypothetical protein
MNDNTPEFIIIHHSASRDDNKSNDWEGIRRYHKSYRHNGNIITADQAKTLAGQGIKTGLEWPWQDIGYHYGIEYVNGIPVIQKGRDELTHGAHCSEDKMNFRSLGICVVGNFDRQPPHDEVMRVLIDLCATKCKTHNIPPENIQPHRKYATYKSCPGLAFPFDYLKQEVGKMLGVKQCEPEPKFK